MHRENQNLEPYFFLKGGRAPLVDSEKIRQLKVFARETERKIERMEKNRNINTQSIVIEKLLLLNIQMNLACHVKSAIQSEFCNRDYFSVI